MTKRQEAIIRKMENLVAEGYATKEYNEEKETTTYMVKYIFDEINERYYSARLVITEDEFKMLKGDHINQKLLGPKSYKKFEVEVDRLVEDIKTAVIKKAQRARIATTLQKEAAEQEAYEEELRNDGVTFNNDQLVDLLEDDRTKVGERIRLDILGFYNFTQEHGFGVLTMNKCADWDEDHFERADKVFTELGINEFVITSHSTALIDMLDGWCKQDWQIAGMLEQTDRNKYNWDFSRKEADQYKGVRFVKAA